ncbi:hypothetical protein BT69DRAFT_1325953 [Atractiella rhizophila]|nr:hypothetical protein BT69DRAFT_1325953 [Atractiella rhizophila]
MATLDILGLGKRSRTSVDIAKRNNEDRMGLHLASPRSERMRSLNLITSKGARDTIGIRRHRLKPSTIRLLVITKAKLRLDRTRERMELLGKLEEAEKMHEMQVLAESQS